MATHPGGHFALTQLFPGSIFRQAQYKACRDPQAKRVEVAESPDRPKRPGGPPKGGRPGSARPAKGRPAAGGRPQRDGERPDRPHREGDRPQRPRTTDGDKPAWKKHDGDKPAWKKREDRPEHPRSEHPRRDGDRPDRPQRGSDRPGRPGQGEKRLWTKDGKPARGDVNARERETPEDRDPFGLRSVRNRHDDPVIPDDVEAKDLDRVARAQLKTLSKDNADGVARHLVMAARLIADDPKLAHEHAISAARRAGRIAVVRETLAITAYSIGDYTLALRELRTYRRISGRDDQLPMMVDSERGLGRPEKALELGRSVPRSSLPVEVQVELAIAMSGARLDLGQTDAALVELQIPALDPDTAFSWSPALFDAYAAVLEDLGRTEEAEEWFARSDRAAAALGSGDADEDEESTIEVFEEELEGDEPSLETPGEAGDPVD